MDVTSAYGEVVADEAARDAIQTSRGLGPNDANFRVQYPNGRVDRWTGSGTWVTELASGGAVGVSDAPYQTKIIEAGGFTYIAKAPAGTAEATAGWLAYRIDANGSIMYANASQNFDNVATDLTALSYSYS